MLPSPRLDFPHRVHFITFLRSRPLKPQHLTTNRRASSCAGQCTGQTTRFDSRQREGGFLSVQPRLHRPWDSHSLLSNGHRVISPGTKQPELENDDSPPPRGEVQNVWSSIYTPPYISVFTSRLRTQLRGFSGLIRKAGTPSVTRHYPCSEVNAHSDSQIAGSCSTHGGGARGKGQWAVREGPEVTDACLRGDEICTGQLCTLLITHQDVPRGLSVTSSGGLKHIRLCSCT
jgi:hypothetical protein